MSFGDVVNCAVLILALGLMASVTIVVRPANGSRPLLIGFAGSAVVAVIIGVTRVFAIDHQVRPWFGLIMIAWLLLKLWALWAAALHQRHPLVFVVRRFFRRFEA